MTSVIATEGLGKRYRKKWALAGCTLSIPAGHVVGLLGPNGAGKSTLINLATGMLAPSAGTIEVLGNRPAAGPAQLARVGYLAQDAPLYAGLSVADHLRLGAHLNPGWDGELARRRVERLGLDPGQKAGTLSGGQRAQLALSLAVAKRPELLILDEPVASLDPLARREFLQDLMEAVAERQVSVVLSSHLISDLERACDYVIVLVGSRVRVAGSASNPARPEPARRQAVARRDLRAGSIACVNISAGLAAETDENIDTGSKLVIAVDGPSGAGKSSASRGVARALGLRYLDTGATYRALTWWLLEHGLDTTDPGVVAAHAADPRIEVGTDPETPWTRVDGHDVSAAIRTREVTAAVSAVAKVPQVRTHLIAMQRDIIAASTVGVVAEGRDIGTVVAPEAPVKVFLTADNAARAVRRAEQANWSQTTTRAEQDRRDSMDAAQSGKAADAVEIDSTALSLDEVIETIVRMARRAQGRQAQGRQTQRWQS